MPRPAVASTPGPRFRRGRVSLTLVILLGTFFAMHAPMAAACGGFFCQNNRVDQVGERIVFTINDDGTVTSLIEIQQTGSAEDFSWVLPIPKAIEITYEHMEIETAEISFSSFGGNDYLRSPERAGRYLTHLTTDISPEEMTIDPLFALEAGRADVSNVRDASELTGLWDCERNGTDGGDDVELANSDALDSTSESGSVTATPAESVGGGMLFSRRSTKNKLTESS
ncbi:MAG: hypothetical protein ACI8Y4_001962 [Candidatus Poriferisodalaceae bacterium]|jgi:hypothetical protein